MHHLRIEGDLYDTPTPDINDAPWPTEKVEVAVSAEQPEKNEFLQDLEAGKIENAAGTEMINELF